jgi:hypothetical protein
MNSALAFALKPSVVKRALKYAGIVGAVLIAINHGDAILRGDFPPGRLFRMGLTVLVPYVVSTLSSVGTMRDIAMKSSTAAPPEPPPRPL